MSVSPSADQVPRQDEGSRLARAFRAGDEEAFAGLVALFRERLYRLAYRLTGSAEDALDVVQDALWKVYRNIGGWNERSAFYSWLYRVTTNLAIDRLRRRRKDRDLVAHARQERRPPVPDPAATVSSRDDRDHHLAIVERHIAALPDGQRAVMVLRHFEGLSLKEIAEVRGCAIGTVKSALHQAFRNVQRGLEAEADSKTEAGAAGDGA